MEIEELLESIGLSKQETRCFLSLYQLKEAKTGEISKRSRIATSNIYPVLDSLMQKGLITCKLINNVRAYMPSAVESLKHLIEDKQKKLDEQKVKVQEAIEALEISQDEKTFSNYKFFSGMAGVKSLWFEILEDMKRRKGILKVYGSTRKGTKALEAFYDEFHENRIKEGIPYHLIISKDYKERSARRKRQGAKVKETDMQNDSVFGVYEDIFLICHVIGKTPIGFLIRDKTIADSFNHMFEKIWKII